METNLADRNRIDDFKAWALKLECPVSSLPSDSALNRLLKSNHTNLQKLMDQVRSRSEVKLIRDNLLVHSHANSKLLSERQLSKLPKHFKNFKKVEKLNCRISELKPRVEELKNKVKEKQLVICEKADQVMKAKKIYQANQSQSIKLKQKRAQLIDKIAEEKKIENMIKNNMPFDCATSTKGKTDAHKAIEKSVQYLSRIYDETGDREFTKIEREKVEQELKKILSGIPVVMLFEAIKFHNENEMKFVDEKFCTIDVIPENKSITGAFNIAVTKAKMKVYFTHLKTLKLKEEHEQRVEQYVHLYDQYLAQILTEMKIFNSSDVELFSDSICGDYLKEYGTWISNQAMLAFHKEKLNNLQQLATERDDLLKGNDLVIAELSGMYEKIEKNYNLILDDMVSLGDINKNMKHLQAYSKYTINCTGDKSMWNTSFSALNSTFGSMVPSITINSAPAEYLNELLMLVGIPNARWSRLPLKISMDVNVQCCNAMFSPLFPLLTANTCLRELKLKWEWFKVINGITNSIECNTVAPEADNSELVVANLNAETTKMFDLIKELKFMYQMGSKSVAEIQKYLSFLLDTSLGSFIPKNVLINGRDYLDYEQEFLFACSLISKSMKEN